MNKVLFIISIIFFSLIILLQMATAQTNVQEFNQQFCKEISTGTHKGKTTFNNEVYTSCLSLLEENNLYGAIQQKDWMFCENLKSKMVGDFALYDFIVISTCKARLAGTTKNYSLCEGNTTFERLEREGANRGRADSIPGIDLYCLSIMALKEKNLSILDYYKGAEFVSVGGFKDFTKVEQCKTKWESVESECVIALARDGIIPKEGCELLGNEEQKSLCFSVVGGVQNDTSGCLRSEGYYKELCIEEMATEQRDITLCDKLDSSLVTVVPLYVLPKSKGTNIYKCKKEVPLAFKVNQLDRIIYVILMPFLIVLGGIFIFLKLKSKAIKKRYFIITALYLLYYLSWLYLLTLSSREEIILAKSSLLVQLTTSISDAARYFHANFASIILFLLAPISFLNGVGGPYFGSLVWSILEFFTLIFYVVIFPELFKIKSKKLKYGLIIATICLTIFVAISSWIIASIRL